PEVPIIHFGTGTAGLLEEMYEAGGSEKSRVVIGIDWRVRLDEAWRRLGETAVMGNLDPVHLFAGREFIIMQTQQILNYAASREGHIFNLGHGILPETPVDNVIALVEAVHELSAKRQFNQ
ncbi:MAG: uroporphyrinogen decarboxylase family protein, partial [Pyrinomonadaceae bacterium]